MHWELSREFQSTRSLHGFNGHFEVDQWLVACDFRVGKHKCPETDIAARLAILGEDDFVEVRWDGDVWWVPNHLVRDPPLVVHGIFPGQVERARDDPDARVGVRETSTEVFQVCPVISVESIPDLGAHVGQKKSLVHGFLAPLCVCRGHLVASVISTSEVVQQFRSELGGYRFVFDKTGMSSVARIRGQGSWRDVLGYPVRIPIPSVIT